ncbi:MAG: alpha/beta hydrolase [Alphaproteobacteria bacterium]|nr:alpha/beta hydrolase [Alphaproteobacteria bacterium SS10]
MSSPEFLSLPDGRKIAYHRTVAPGAEAGPWAVFLGGFRSDMTGTKATFFEDECRRAGVSFLRFDYTGHGESSGDFAEGCIGDWTQDAIDAVDHLTEGKLILIGSSMGGWIMLNVALARLDRLAAIMGLASAPDFTEDLMFASMTAEEKEALKRDGRIEQPNDYSDEPYLITNHLIEEGRNHLRLREPMPIDVPIRLVHGMRDTDVPWCLSSKIMDLVSSEDAELLLLKNGDHRLSDPYCLSRLSQVIGPLLAEFSASG